jgi:chorismate mutase
MGEENTEFEIGTGEETPQPQEAQDQSQDNSTVTREERAPQVDYSAQIEELRRHNAQLQEVNSKYAGEIHGFKSELATFRDSQREQQLLMMGDPRTKAKYEEQAKQQEIKEELYKILPHLKQIENGIPSQSARDDQFFLNTARTEGFKRAEQLGFKDEASKQFMLYAADMMIQVNPQWKQRFFDQKDMSVLDEVATFMNKQIFEPRDRAIEQKVLERLRKQNKVASPMPSRGGSQAKPTGNSEKIDSRNADDRSKVYAHLFSRHAGSGEE